MRILLFGVNVGQIGNNFCGQPHKNICIPSTIQPRRVGSKVVQLVSARNKLTIPRSRRTWKEFAVNGKTYLGSWIIHAKILWAAHKITLPNKYSIRQCLRRVLIKLDEFQELLELELHCKLSFTDHHYSFRLGIESSSIVSSHHLLQLTYIGFFVHWLPFAIES